MDFYDRVLIRLRRDYSKDEAMAAFLKKLDERDREVGELKSEIAHLEHQLKQVDIEVRKLARVDARKDELYKTQIELIDKQKKDIKELKRQRDALIAKCYSFENQSNN